MIDCLSESCYISHSTQITGHSRDGFPSQSLCMVLKKPQHDREEMYYHFTCFKKDCWLRMLDYVSWCIHSFVTVQLITGKFREPIFHPNVFPSGAVDLNFLSQPQTYWKSSITIMEVTAIAALLYMYMFPNYHEAVVCQKYLKSAKNWWVVRLACNVEP